MVSINQRRVVGKRNNDNGANQYDIAVAYAAPIMP